MVSAPPAQRSARNGAERPATFESNTVSDGMPDRSSPIVDEDVVQVVAVRE
jgi:hypothetical protein